MSCFINLLFNIWYLKSLRCWNVILPCWMSVLGYLICIIIFFLKRARPSPLTGKYPQKIIGYTCIGNSLSRILNSKWCVRTNTVGEIYDKKWPANNRQIHIRLSLPEEIKYFCGFFFIIFRFINRQFKRNFYKSFQFRSTDLWADDSFVDW